jgi:hypothetical protein
MAALPRHSAVKKWIESVEGRIRELLKPPERVMGRDPRLNQDVGKAGAAALLLTAHQHWGSCLLVVGMAEL